MKTLTTLVAVLAIACGGKAAPESTETPRAETPASEAPPAEPTSDPAQVKADLLAAETAAYEKARPVFEAHCAKCHIKASKKAKPKTLGHFDMTSYPFGGHHAEDISAEVRKALGIGGGKPTMPFDDPGAVKGEELALIAAWADAYDKAHEGGAHQDRGHGGEHHHGGHKH
jgi:hypothetical protein